MADDFFDGIYQVDTESGGEPIKFPIFYHDARSFTAIFAANWFKLRKMLPDWRYFPAQVLPGVGAVAFTAFEYYDTDIRPYNEFAIAIILNSPHLAPVPGYNLLRQYFLNTFEAYIYHLPVTTNVALRAGIDFYNYPKFIAGIDFTDTADEVACDLTHEGKRICKLTSKKLPATRSYEAKFMCRLYQDRQPQGAEFKVNVREGTDRWLPSTRSAWNWGTTTSPATSARCCCPRGPSSTCTGRPSSAASTGRTTSRCPWLTTGCGRRAPSASRRAAPSRPPGSSTTTGRRFSWTWERARASGPRDCCGTSPCWRRCARTTAPTLTGWCRWCRTAPSSTGATPAPPPWR